MQCIRLTKDSKRHKNSSKEQWFVFFLLFFFIFSCLENPKSPQEKEAVPYPWKLICIGNGITTGVDQSKGDAYPALLEAKLKKDTRPRAKVVNAGLKGETITGVNQRIEWMLQQRFSAILLAMGERDLKEEKREDWERCLQKIGRTNPEALILIGIIDKDCSFAKVKTFFKLMKGNYNLVYIDLELKPTLQNTIWWQDNGLYLTPLGQKEIADRLFSHVKK